MSVTIRTPSSWLVVFYEVPSEPSKLRVRLWRDFKRMGAIYPQMSICVVPDNKDNRKSLERLEKMASTGGKLFKINGKALAEQDQNQLEHIFRIERDKQYDEILEECQEYIDEILLNIKERKTSQEEVEEMEEALDGLKRWLDRVKSIDWVENSAASIRVKKLLDKCEASLHKYIELAHPKRSNYSH